MTNDTCMNPKIWRWKESHQSVPGATEKTAASVQQLHILHMQFQTLWKEFIALQYAVHAKLNFILCMSTILTVFSVDYLSPDPYILMKYICQNF